jgi:hypothetical protein
MSNMSSGEQKIDAPKSSVWAIPNGHEKFGIVDVDIHRKQDEERHYKFQTVHDLDRYCPVVLASERFAQIRTVWCAIAKRCCLDTFRRGPSITDSLRRI